MNVLIKQAVGFLFAITLFVSSNAVASEQCNTIDAFTSASIYHSLKIQQSQAYKNYAIIHWSEDWKDELKVFSYKLLWGTQPGVFTDSLNLKPFTQKALNIDTLLSLQENTKYYAQFYRDYNHEYEPFLRNFCFTTPPLPTIPPISADDPGYLPVNFAKPLPHYVVANHEINAIDIYTATGKRVAHTAISSVKNINSIINSSIKTPGLYIAYFKGINNQLLLSEKILINK
jgi:hypothetical protein